MVNIINVVDQRNLWRDEMEQGNFTPHEMYPDYLKNRDSDLWRASRQIEKMFEYIRYLEEQLKCTGTNSSI